MINNFTYFLYNNEFNDYLNCYSTFLMVNKDLKSNILNHRMKLLINCYSNNERTKKNKLIEYYIRGYKDNYLNKQELKHSERFEFIEDIEKRDDDIEDHYKYMFINYPIKPTIDYDELDKQYELKLQLEEAEKQREKEIMLENELNEDYYDEIGYNNTDDDYDEFEYDIIDEY